MAARPLENQTWHTNGCLEQKLSKFGFHTHTIAVWPMKQSSILSAKFDYPGACRNFSFLTIVHDCESGAWIAKTISSRCFVYIILGYCLQCKICNDAIFFLSAPRSGMQALKLAVVP